MNAPVMWAITVYALVHDDVAVVESARAIAADNCDVPVETTGAALVCWLMDAEEIQGIQIVDCEAIQLSSQDAKLVEA